MSSPFSVKFQGLICAYPGVGKSVTLGTGVGKQTPTGREENDPRLGTILHYDSDNKIQSIASRIEQEVTLEDLLNPDFKLAPRGINLIRYLHIDFEEDEDEVCKLINLIYTGGGATRQIDTLFFDTLSSYDQSLYFAAEEKKRNHKDEKTRNNGFWSYNEVAKRILPLLTTISNTPINFIGTAHVNEGVKEEGETDVYTVPKFSGKKLGIAATGIFPFTALIETIKQGRNEPDTSQQRRFIFSHTYRFGIQGIHNQYEETTLGESQVYDRTDEILPLILDGVGIPRPVAVPTASTPVATKTTTKTTQTTQTTQKDSK